ncbi:biotinidase isoform X2 [Ambystoma mexicanum]|uniref:biotinidase isoform X2 n=1 Tax=Ambystoma mexicanum TaxID=8296 RepID=UPI0037E726D6
MKVTGCILILLHLFCPEALSLDVDKGAFYMAAVYEHRPVLTPDPKVPHTRRAALELMYKNLAVYEEQVKAAAEQVLQRLSCMALNGSMFVVANVGTKMPCQHLDPGCPPDGQYQFNTDVVFSAAGTLVARYHKQNLYFEDAFNSPPEMEHIVFDTPFANGFGLFTCFDILFREPAVGLVTQHQVKHVLYPTAWMNQLPLLSAVQIQRGFSSSFNINFLAANIHEPSLGLTGSGIYTPAKSHYYHNMKSQEGKLIVAQVPVNPSLECSRKKESRHKVSQTQGLMVDLPLDSSVCQVEQQGVRCEGKPVGFHKPTPAFFSEMMYDNFTLVLITGAEGGLQVCSNSLCCSLSYRNAALSGETYALGVFDGLHTIHGTYYLQVCTLVKCGETCGQEITEAGGVLDFQLWGNFSTSYVFPLLLMSGMTLDLPGDWGWAGHDCYMSKEKTSSGLVTAALYGRWYEKD